MTDPDATAPGVAAGATAPGVAAGATAPAVAASADGLTSTRRDLVRGGVAAGVAAAVAAAVAPPLLSPASARAAPYGDAGVLLFVLSVEQVIVYGYEQALASGVISASGQPVLKLFLSQEREHIDALSVHLVRLGGAVPAPPTDLQTFEVALRKLKIRRNPAKLRNERQYVGLLVRIETALAAVYEFAIEQLADDKLIQTAAQIMANEGQHATVLRELTSPGNVQLSVPRPFVSGSA
jgi:hypothetical protein